MTSERTVSPQSDDLSFADWHSGIWQKDQPPEYLYKFCKRGDFNNFISKGSLRLGSSYHYREAYEKNGAEYGDNLEGVFSRHMIGARKTLQYLSHDHILSLSKSYTRKMHRMWWERKGCNYNLCVKFRAKKLLSAVATAIPEAKPGQKRLVMVGSCSYGNHQDFNDTKFVIMTQSFMKPLGFQIEDEYRMAVHMHGSEEKKPLDVQIDGIDDLMADVLTVPTQS